MLLSSICKYIFKLESDGFNKMKIIKKYNKLNILLFLYLNSSYLSSFILFVLKTLSLYLSLLFL